MQSNDVPKPPTVFDQFEAIVDSANLSAAQKCIAIKLRCRADGKTYSHAIVSNEGLMRAASLRDPRTLRAELRGLQGKSETRRKKDDTDEFDATRALVKIEQERGGKATIYGLNRDVFDGLLAEHLARIKAKKAARTARPPASDVPPAPEPPPACHAHDPLRATHPHPLRATQPDPFPSGIYPDDEDDRAKNGCSINFPDEWSIAFHSIGNQWGVVPGAQNFATLPRDKTDAILHGEIEPYRARGVDETDLNAAVAAALRTCAVKVMEKGATKGAVRRDAVGVGAARAYFSKVLESEVGRITKCRVAEQEDANADAQVRAELVQKRLNGLSRNTGPSRSRPGLEDLAADVLGTIE
jgi:hypothetical protein